MANTEQQAPAEGSHDAGHTADATQGTTAMTEAGHGGEAHGAFPPFDSATFPSQILWLAISFGLLYLHPTLSRISFNLWNSGVAVFTAGFLLRGIINLSGRSTTLDWPYWLMGAGFLGLALVSIGLSLFRSKKLTDEMVRV